VRGLKLIALDPPYSKMTMWRRVGVVALYSYVLVPSTTPFSGTGYKQFESRSAELETLCSLFVDVVQMMAGAKLFSYLGKHLTST
jgi:hypothetical protein